MEKRAPGFAAVETALGTLGLFLIAVLGWAADHVSASANTPTERVMRWLAARSITGVTAIGSLVDSIYAGAGDRSNDSGRSSARAFATQQSDSWTAKRQGKPS